MKSAIETMIGNILYHRIIEYTTGAKLPYGSRAGIGKF